MSNHKISLYKIYLSTGGLTTYVYLCMHVMPLCLRTSFHATIQIAADMFESVPFAE
jgi:hypothetical protein